VPLEQVRQGLAIACLGCGYQIGVGVRGRY
jgi:hypothetical protein